MKKVYICGDSFGSYDSDYPEMSWHEKLAVKLYGQVEIVNLSKVCASNLLISLQVDRAIEQRADYVIFMCTSVLRDEVKFKQSKNTALLIDRFVDITSQVVDPLQDLISYTVLNINQTFLSAHTDLLTEYAVIKDLELLIYKDRCIIENTLQKLTDQKIPFVFDQGGFENPLYGATKTQYFQKFQSNLSSTNLWNHVPVRCFRPYFHLIDQQITNEIADYYYKLIIEALI